MISRIWHGYALPENADAYETLLRSEIFDWIASKKISGYRGIQLYRRHLEKEVEFMTIMWFESVEAVKCFAGEDYEAAVILQQDHTLLTHYDTRSQHYDMVVDLKAI